MGQPGLQADGDTARGVSQDNARPGHRHRRRARRLEHGGNCEAAFGPAVLDGEVAGSFVLDRCVVPDQDVVRAPVVCVPGRVPLGMVLKLL